MVMEPFSILMEMVVTQICVCVDIYAKKNKMNACENC